MRYTTLTYVQLFVMSILIGLTAAGSILSYDLWAAQKLLPVVVQDQSGACVKIINFENGHAFTCPDKDVLLRRYRKEMVK